MIKINLICLGDIKETYLVLAINEYAKRIQRFATLNIIELKENAPQKQTQQDILNSLEKDAKEIEKYLKGYVICLDVAGKMASSEELASKISTTSLNYSEITFIIGASNGISERIKAVCNEKISFSKMTFPHQLMRVIFLEQLYRAFTIINHIAYHK